MTQAISIVFEGSMILTFLFGVWVGKRRPRISLCFSVLSLLAILFRVYLRFFPYLEFTYLSDDWYASWRAWWFFPFGILILALGFNLSKSKAFSYLSLSSASVLLAFVLVSSYQTATWDYNSVIGKPNKLGYCFQSTPITCGAAAAASFLATQGRFFSEKDLAISCGTNPITGTDEFGIIKGIRLLTDGKTRLKPEVCNWKFLVQAKKPVLATTKFGVMIDHWVLIIKTTSEEVELFDPLLGRKTLKRNVFETIWRCVILHEPPNA